MSVNDIRKLTPQQQDEQLQTIIRFLENVHPYLGRQCDFRPAVELRPLCRGDKNYKLTKSLVLWDLSEKTISRLRDFLSLHNGQATCLYYSVFTFDNNKKTMTSRGTPAKTGKITTKSAISTEEIALDFDNIGFEDYINLSDRFETLGIHALWVNTGHGYHAHILLKSPLEDKSLLRRCVYKFRSKGFNCDSACVDPARIMRLPGTFNNKCFQDDDYAFERSDPPACRIVQDSHERYDLDDIMSLLEKLPTVSFEDEKAYLEVKSTPGAAKEKPTKGEKDAIGTLPGDIALGEVSYTYLSNYDLPEPVKKILAYTPKGYRNCALGFMIRLFKTQYKLGKRAIYETVKLWGEMACVPAYDEKEFIDDFTRLYNYNGLGYDVKLARMYGGIDFDDFIQLRKKDIHIPHKFFRDFANLDGKDVRTYLVIKMLEHIDEVTTQDKIAQTLGISTRALRPTIQNLVKSGHCFMKKGNAKLKVPNTYYTTRLNSVHDGFMILGYNDIRAFITDLCEQSGRTRSNAELKLYLYMLWKFRDNDIYMSQVNLGKNIGVEQNTISVMVYRLQEKHYLKVEKSHFRSCLESCKYMLLR